MPPTLPGRLDELQVLLGVTFDNLSLLEQAMTHRSYANEKRVPNNERLEFLGDAVLSLIVTAQLYRNFPELPEGTLARLRAGLVRNSVLADITIEMGLDSYIRLGKGEQRNSAELRTTGKRTELILSGVLEALIAAIYRDRGPAAAEEFVLKHIMPKLPLTINKNTALDPKTWLQQVAATEKRVPHYAIVESGGPEHNKFFRVQVSWGGQAWGEGRGSSIKSAETKAAEAALAKLAEMGKLPKEEGES